LKFIAKRLFHHNTALSIVSNGNDLKGAAFTRTDPQSLMIRKINCLYDSFEKKSSISQF
jgi:hypothetical protein